VIYEQGMEFFNVRKLPAPLEISRDMKRRLSRRGPVRRIMFAVAFF